MIGSQTALDLGERVVPRYRLEVPVAPDQRRAQAIGVGVELLQRVALRTDEAAAEDVVRVAADAHDFAAAGADLETAGGLAERAGVVVHPVGRLIRHDRDLPW